MLRPATERGRASARRTRATAVGVAAVVIAVLGHAAGGGGWPPGAVAAPGLAVGALAGLALSGVAWTVLRLATGLAGTQLAVHTMLWIGSSGSAVDPRLASLPMSRVESHAHQAVAMTPHMLGGHAVAIVLTAIVLVSTERAARLLAQLARRLAPRGTPVDVPHRLPRPIRGTERSPVVPRLLHLVSVRGHAPPATALALT